MSNVPTNLIPTKITGLPEYTGSSTLGYLPYVLEGRTYKVQFANIAAVGAVPSTREINTGSGLGGGGDLSANRTLYILPGGVDDSRLSVTGVTAGTYGAADTIPVFTVNAQGRVTAVTNTPIVLSGYVPISRTITAGNGLTGGGDLSANRSFAVNFSSTTPEPLGIGSSGVSNVAARGDHVHPAVDLSDTTETQGVLPLSRGGTGNSLSPVAGAIVYSSNDKLYLTTAGSVGQVLRSGGPGGVPFWTDVGAGTVISVAVATANGFAGTVASPTLSPVITLSTTVSGMVKGNGTAVSAATAGVDYVEPGAYTASGLTMATARLLGRTTASVGAAQEISVGTGLTLSSGSLVNAAPDQVVSLTAGTAISVTGTYPSFTVTNTAPDQVVSLTGAGTTTVTGTYPSFTITSNDSTAGTVTSINASGGTTGMSFTGGPVTSAGTLTLNGTLAVSNGGTGATDAVAALTNLGAYPASNPAGYTSNVGTVTSVSGTGTVSGLSLSGTVTSAGSLTLGGTLAVLPSNFASQTANTVLAAPNGSAGTPTFRAIVAADIPTLNQNTTGTASNVTGIVAVANGGTGASVAATARTNLGAAASGANTDITSIALTTGTISTSPVSGTDIVNKAYADSIASGINFHQSVRLATAAALPAYTYNNGASGVGATITANANAALSVDGVAVVVGNRILVKNESGAAEAYNGVYTVTQTGSGAAPYILTRATDFDSAGSGVDQIDAGDFFLVTAGSTQANTSWVQQTPLPITVGTTAIVFTQFAAPVLYSAGTGLTLTGTTFSITNTGVSASTYGSASSVPVIAVNAQGQLTSASSSSIAIAASQITSGALAIANGGTGATSAATALTNLGAYPASNPAGYTSNTGTVTSVNLTAGTGVSVSGGPITSSGSITVTNTAPDQVVSLTGAGATTVTGTYPNFTISSPTSGAGTVTSIDVSGGTTGLTTSGGPVTSSGTITLAGTLNVANGGTGATTLSSGYLLKGNGTSAVSASVIYDNGTNAGIGTASPGSKLDVRGVITGGDGTIQTVISYLAAAGVTGTLSNHPYVFYANNAERARIDTSGNLGVGSSSPSARITAQVNSGNYILDLVNGSETPFALRTYNHGSGSAPGLVFTQGLYYNTTENASIKFYRGGGATGGYLGFTAGAGTEYLSINGSGNVTASVDMRAPIFYDSANTSYYLDPTGSTSLNTAGNLITSGNLTLNNGANRYVRIGSATNYSYDLQTTGDDFQIIEAGTTPRLTIKYPSGNVGIGTTSPLAKLHTVASTPTGIGALPSGVTGILDSSGNNYLLFRHTADNATYSGIAFQDNNMGGYVIFGNYGANPSDQIAIAGYNGGILQYGTSDTINPALRTTVASWNSTGLQINNGDMRAPIYYDSNNTAYYLDPASGSNLNGTLVNSGGTAMTAGWNRNMMLAATFPVLVFNSANAKYSGIGVDYTSAAAGMYFWVNGSSSDISGTGTLALSINTGNYVVANDFRAPIFRDSDNTAYYGDFASTSSLNSLIVGTNGSTLAYNAAATGNLYFGSAGGDASTYYHITTNMENVGGNYSKLDFKWYTGQRFYTHYAYGGVRFKEITTGNTLFSVGESDLNVRVANAIYSPIYYDGNNSAYYVDPAAGSRLGGQVLFDGGTVIQGNGDVYSRRSSGTTGVYYFADGGSKYLFWDGGAYFFGSAGYTQSDVSMRAPIFYDSNNTGFFIDPASTSSLITLLAQNLGVYDSGQTNDPYGKIAVTRATDGNNYSYYGLTRAGQLGAGFGIDTSNRFWWGSATPGYAGVASAIGMTMSMGGTLSVTADVRAPIFYDSNNTGYYLDPNSSGLALRTSGYWVADSTAWAGEINGKIQFHGNNWYFGASDSWIFRATNGTQPFYVTQTGVAVASGDMRAPIFYDNNNTGFYMDPASGTVLGGSLAINGGRSINISSGGGSITIQGDAGGWGTGMYFLGSSGTNRGGFGALGGGNGLNYLWVGNALDNAGLYVYPSNYAESPGSLRAPIFFDNNNTAYYVDPTGTSALSTVTFGSSPAGGGGGGRIIPSTGSPYSLRQEFGSDNSGWRYGIAKNVSGTVTVMFYVQDNGDCVATGNITAYSDIRIKANVETIPSALEKLDQIRGVTYTRTDMDDKERRYAGVIAQEIEAVLPEAIGGDEEIKTVDYNATIALLIQAVKELRDEVEALRK